MPPPPIAGALPVAFDDDAADALAADLDAMAQQLAAMISVTDAGAGRAVRDWAGFTRTWFDREHSATLDELRRSVRAARAAAAQVRQSKTAAAMLQNQRNVAAARRRQAERDLFLAAAAAADASGQ